MRLDIYVLVKNIFTQQYYKKASVLGYGTLKQRNMHKIHYNFESRIHKDNKTRWTVQQTTVRENVNKHKKFEHLGK